MNNLKKAAIFLLVFAAGSHAQMVIKNSDLQPIMIVTNDGDVGIGLTNPAQKLHVSGNAQVSGQTHSSTLRLSGRTPQAGKVPFSKDASGNIYYSDQPTTDGQILSWDASNTKWQVTDKPDGISGGVATRIAFWTGGNTIGHSSNLYWNNTSNRLGIGTTAPARNLDVTGSIEMNGYIYHGGDDNTYMGFPTSDIITFRTDGVDRMHIHSNGNVGIGLTNPAARLHTTGTVRFAGVGSTTSQTRIVTLDNNGNVLWRAPGSWTGDSGNDGDWTITGTNLYSVPSGNVGIGTTVPAAKLHTVGHVRLEGLGEGAGLNRVLVQENDGDIRYRTVPADVLDDDDNSYVTGASVSGTTTKTMTLTRNGGLSSLTPSWTDERGVVSVSAGNGLTGGGSSSSVTLNVGDGDGIQVNSNNIAVNTRYSVTVASDNIQLQGDESSPGSNRYYGTNGSGVRDWLGNSWVWSSGSSVTGNLWRNGDVSIGTNSVPGNAKLTVDAEGTDTYAIYARDKKSYFTEQICVGENPNPPNSDYLLFLQGDNPAIGLTNGNENFHVAIGVGSEIMRLYSQRGVTLFMDYDNNHSDEATVFSIGHNNSSMVSPYENLAQFYGNGNFWILNEMSAASYVDRTPYPHNLQTAIDAVYSMHRLPDGQYQIEDKEHQLDHSLLHDFIRSEDNKRDLSATVSAQNEVIKHLLDKTKLYEERLEKLESLLHTAVSE